MEIEEFEMGTEHSYPLTHYRVSVKAAFVNPLLRERLGATLVACLMTGELDESRLPSSFRHAQASWRRMLSVQPPLQPLLLQDRTDLYKIHLKQLSGWLRNRACDSLRRAILRADVCTVAGDIEEMRCNDEYHNNGFPLRFGNLRFG